MSLSCSPSPLRRVGLLATALFLAASLAGAQSLQSNATDFSSSTESSSQQELASLEPALAALPAAPAPAAAAAGQYSGGGGAFHHAMQKFTIEAGGGFNGPTSNSSNYITWGGNFTVGGGLQFNPHLATLIEYQYIDDKLPGKLIAETGASGGHAHIWSFTLDPVVDLLPKASNDLYVTGGGGFYRKVTSFTVLAPTEFCSYFYCGIGYAPATVGHFSSNQGGWSVGAGYIHRMGGIYGTSKMKLFAEVRYLDVLSPALTSQPNGLGTVTVGSDTKLIPVTLGVRW